MPVKTDDSLVALLEQLDKALKPSSKKSRFKTLIDMCRETGWSRNRVHNILLAADKAGRLERGLVTITRLDGAPHTLTGFAIKSAK